MTVRDLINTMADACDEWWGNTETEDFENGSTPDIFGAVNKLEKKLAKEGREINLDMEITKQSLVKRAVDNLNVKWSTEDLEAALEDQGVPVTEKNLSRLATKINKGFAGTIIESINERLAQLAWEVKNGN